MKELGGFFTKETVMESPTFPGSLSSASGSGDGTRQQRGCALSGPRLHAALVLWWSPVEGGGCLEGSSQLRESWSLPRLRLSLQLTAPA